MKLLLRLIILTIGLSVISEKASACHALALVNTQINNLGTSVDVTASSDSPTCGCAPYWLDVEVRCMGEPFDGAPFNPGYWGPLSTYPYFQSTKMNKNNCVVQQYPWVNIPFTGLCPGIQYQVRMRENHHGQVGPWSAALTFTVPGVIDPLVANVNASNVNLCAGDCTDITASVVGGCGLAPLYSWNTGQTTPTINVCPTQTTTYTVTITEQCSNLTVTESITVYVVPTPIAGTAAATPSSVCVGETTNLTLTGYDGNIQWESAPNSGGPWTAINGATTDNETSPPINSNTCFRAVVAGCGPSDISNVVCVTIAPAPDLTVSNETICNGETTTLTTTVNPTGGTYLWTPTNQTSADLTNVSPTTTTTYNVEYSLNGCVVNGTGTVTVNPQPTTLALTGSTICDGDNATITATPDVAGGTYTWTPNVSTGNTATVSPAVGTNTYTVDYDVNGCTYSESVDIIVNPVPTVSIADEEICNGEQTTLTAVPSIAGGTYLWTPNGETVDNITDNPNATTNYGVTYSLNGCDATANADIIVHPNPTADFDFVNECFGTDVNMNSTSTVAAGTIQSYEWDVQNNGSVDYQTNNISHGYPADGTYDVNLYVETDQGCSHDTTQTVEVYPVANVDFSATPLCLGSPTDFNDLSSFTNGGTIDTWDWDFDDGNTSTQQNPQNTYPSAGIYDVSLTVTTDDGCVSTLNQNVEIYALPTADFTVGDDCYDESISFQNTSLGNATNFEWDFDDGSPINNQENPSHQYSSAGIYNVTLIISTDDGCSDTITNPASAYALPQADFTVDPVCLNNVSDFTDASSVTAVDGDVLTDWSWDFGDGNTSTNQNPSNTYGGENVYNVSLTVTTNYGCSNTYTTDATVWPLPQVDFSPTDVCLEEESQYQDETSISNQYTSNSITGWDWDFGDGVGTSVQQNPIYTYQTDGTFNATLTATSNNGCVNDTTKVVTVHPKPVASFTGQNLTGCSPVCFDLSSTSTVNSPGSIVDYQWNFSDGSSYSSSAPDLQDCFQNNSGNTEFYGVELVVTSDQGCVDDHFEANYIEVYHNPIASFTYSPEEVDILDPSVEINNNSQYADNYNWDVTDYGTSTDYSPTFEWAPEPDSQFIQLVVSTDEGCFDTANAVVNILDRLILYVPNTFTPDNDDFNEVFQPIFTSGFDPFNFNLKIFDRWGEIVFESNDASIGWNGTYGVGSNKLVKDGTYIWKISFKETGKDKRRVLTGHVNVLK